MNTSTVSVKGKQVQSMTGLPIIGLIISGAVVLIIALAISLVNETVSLGSRLEKKRHGIQN